MLMAILTLAIGGWAVLSLANTIRDAITYDDQWLSNSVSRKSAIFALTVTYAALLSFGTSFLTHVLVLPILTAAPIYHFWTRYNYGRQKKNEQESAMEDLRREKKKKEELLAQLKTVESWFHTSIPSQYHTEDRNKYFQFLYSMDRIDEFLRWDDAYRLYMLGVITKKRCICHLEWLEYSEKQAKGDLAWKRIQSKKNRKRLESIPSSEKAATTQTQSPPPKLPTAEQIAVRQKIKEEKKKRAAQIKAEQEQQYLKNLKSRGDQAKAAYKRQW